MRVRNLILAAVMGVGMLVATGEKASANWFSCCTPCYSYCYTPCYYTPCTYTPCYTYSYTPCYTYSYTPCYYTTPCYTYTPCYYYTPCYSYSSCCFSFCCW
jgi:hypothetical protein